MPDASLNLRRPSSVVPTNRSLRRRTGGFLAVTLLGLALAAAACTPTDSSTTTAPSDPSTTAAAAGGGGEASGSSYVTITGLHEAIVDGGFACTLEYPGLRDDATANEVSICTIEDETAYLTIWGDPAQLEQFVASPDGSTGTVALGADWSISVTSPDLATRLADALGGSAPAA